MLHLKHPHPIPEAYRGAVPYLCVRDAKAALEFYKKAFGAKELVRIELGNRIGHAEIEIGHARIMLCDEFPDMNFLSPMSMGGSSSLVLLFVDNVDEVFLQAIDAGAEPVRPIETHFYGDRGGKIVDPFGHSWVISTHVEDVSYDEMKRRAQEMYGNKELLQSWRPEPRP
jgi:PhnB protein